MSGLGVGEPVRRKTLALGRDGERWLRDLPRLVADLAAEWGFTVGDPIAGGSGGFVGCVVTTDGLDAVLKVAIPDGLEGHAPFAGELQVLELGAGHGYVRVWRADEGRRAMLQERLGRPLSALAMPVDAQIDVIAATLAAGWRAVPDSIALRTGAEQAAYLDDFIGARWAELGHPCPRPIVERAQQYARVRRDAFDGTTAVLIHGDAHPANVLEASPDLRVANGFKLIDPDGMRSEPAHDLAIPLRDWSDELAAGDTVGLARAWCARLADRGGADPGAIWEWAFIERVSTGLFLLQLGDPAGRRLLEVATRLADVHS